MSGLKKSASKTTGATTARMRTEHLAQEELLLRPGEGAFVGLGGHGLGLRDESEVHGHVCGHDAFGHRPPHLGGNVVCGRWAGGGVFWGEGREKVWVLVLCGMVRCGGKGSRKQARMIVGGEYEVCLEWWAREQKAGMGS